MNEQSRQTLGGVIARVLEDGAFIFAEEPEGDGATLAEGWNAEGVALSFSGPHAGEIHMWVGEDFAEYAAANMLGLEPEEDGAAAKGRDALRELLNMIVGNYLTERYGIEQVFDLHLPADLPQSAMHADLAHPDSLWLDAEGNLIMFTLRVDDS